MRAAANARVAPGSATLAIFALVYGAPLTSRAEGIANPLGAICARR